MKYKAIILAKLNYQDSIDIKDVFKQGNENKQEYDNFKKYVRFYINILTGLPSNILPLTIDPYIESTDTIDIKNFREFCR